MTAGESKLLADSFRLEMRRLFQEQMCCGPYGTPEERDPLKFALTAFGARVFAGIANSYDRYTKEREKIEADQGSIPFGGDEDGE